MKLKILSLVVVLISTLSCNVAFAQFYSSETVYCYQYVKTINDGISSKKSNPDYIFVNFQNDMMGFYNAGSSLKTIRQKLLEAPYYYEEQAINNLANSYNRWKSSGPGWNPYGQSYSATIYKYNDEYSSTNKYTYRARTKSSHFSYVDSWGQPQGAWGNPRWGSKCYTFSKDKEELIVWSTSDSENRQYYQLIDVDSLKPNTDFLD